MVTVLSKSWEAGVWTVQADVALPGYSFSGGFSVAGPDTMTEADLSAAVLAVFTAG